MSIAIEDTILIGDKLYMLIRGIRILLAYDLQSKKIEMVDVLPVGELYDLTDGIKMYLFDNSIIFTPMGKREIWQFNIVSKKWSKKDLLIDGNEGLDMQLFISAKFNEQLFMVGCHTGFVINFNLNNGREKSIVIDKIVENEKKPYFDRFRYKVIDSKLIVPLRRGKEEIIIYMSDDTMKYDVVKLQEYSDKELESVYVAGDKRIYSMGNYKIEIFGEEEIILYMEEQEYIIRWNDIKEIVRFYTSDKLEFLTGVITEYRGFELEDYLGII